MATLESTLDSALDSPKHSGHWDQETNVITQGLAEISTMPRDFTLELLQNELPDPEIELSVQVDPAKDLTSFTLFLKLPGEIRLKIWRYALPEEAVNIWYYDHGIYIYHCTGVPCSTAGFFGRRRPTPITLSINHESREETLRHLMEISLVPPRSFFFYPAIDRLLIPWSSFLITGFYNKWVVRMNMTRTSAPKFYESVKIIEIRGVRKLWKLWGENHENQRWVEFEEAMKNIPEKTQFNMFPAVEKIIVCPHPPCRSCEDREGYGPGESGKARKTAVESFVKKVVARDGFWNGVVPKMTLGREKYVLAGGGPRERHANDCYGNH